MKYFFLVLLLIATAKCNAGAWGIGSFENDGALDWINELIHFDSASTISKTLETPLNQGYIDLDTCSYVIAAAEVVSAMSAGDLSTLPNELQEWLSQKDWKIDNDLKAMALKSINVCLDTSKSELAQLWYETSFKDWTSVVKELQGRLQ